MKVALAVLAGFTLAAALTYYFQPSLVTGFIPRLNPPDIIVLAPLTRDKVMLRFAVAGRARSPNNHLTVLVLDSTGRTLLFQAVNTDAPSPSKFGNFYLPVDLGQKNLQPGYSITLRVYLASSPESALSIPLTIH